jgi:hypothetical protein
MWWPFGKEKTKVDPKKELEGLLQAQELLTKRYQMKQMTNDDYISRATELNKKIAKCREKIGEDY